MKHGPVTELDKRDKTTSKKIGDDVTSKYCNAVAIFFQFTTNLEQSGSCIYSLWLSINDNLLSYKNWKQNEKISNTTLTLLFRVKALFWPNNADISKIEGALMLKGIFSETTYECVATWQIWNFLHNSNEFLNSDSYRRYYIQRIITFCL